MTPEAIAVNPAIPELYRHLTPNVDRLLNDTQSYEQNVFIVMRFIPSEPLTNVYDSLVTGLARMGLTPLRADQRAYHPELWGNICTYMLGCSKAVIVFEDIEIREFNPNVALELGFMLALEKDCLILKEKRLPQPPTDIIGRLWRAFDSHAPAETIPEQVTRWLVDIGWQPSAKAVPDSVARYVLREASAFHRVLEQLDREFQLEFAFNDRAAQSFRQLADRAMSVGPVFRKHSLLAELAKDDPTLQSLVEQLNQVADIYIDRVLAPLQAEVLSSKDAIQTSQKGLKQVLAADFELIQQIEERFSSR